MKLKLETLFFRNISIFIFCQQQYAKLRCNNTRLGMKVSVSKVLDFRTADIITQVRRNLDTVTGKLDNTCFKATYGFTGRKITDEFVVGTLCHLTDKSLSGTILKIAENHE